MRHNLSEITELIKSRRTIYPEQFSDRKVHKEQLELILNNAIWAPTHGNTQPWRFKVFTGESLERLSLFLGQTYIKLTDPEKINDKKLAKIIARPKKSSAVIAICMNRQAEEKVSELDEIAAVCCAVQNMHLTCTAYGLGGFWSTPGFANSEEMKEFLNIESKDRCLGLFYIGYPAIEWPQGQRKPIEYVTEWITR